MDQSEVVHQFHGGGGGQGSLKVATHCLAGDQRCGALKVQWSAAVFRPAMLVDPTQVVAQEVVEKAFPAVEYAAKFSFHGLPVCFVLGDHSGQFTKRRENP